MYDRISSKIVFLLINSAPPLPYSCFSRISGESPVLSFNP
jgi:hypothetical protein